MQWPADIKPQFKHLKDEMLHNKYEPLTERTWNGILLKCNKILRGEFDNQRKIKWAYLLRKNRIKMKHLVALKLYTDFDHLQRTFKQLWRSSSRQKWGTGELKHQRKFESFYHWKTALDEAFQELSKVVVKHELHQPDFVFSGIKHRHELSQLEGMNYGFTSTTTDLHVARSFAGKDGIIIVFRPQKPDKPLVDKNGKELLYPRLLDMSWISDYDEREYLVYDRCLTIETWMTSFEYDKYYHYYHNSYTKGKVLQPPSCLFSVQEFRNHSDMLRLIPKLIEDDTLNFNSDKFKEEEKINLFSWLYHIADDSLIRRKRLDAIVDFDEAEDAFYVERRSYKRTLDDNLEYAIRKVNKIVLSSEFGQKCMQKINNDIEFKNMNPPIITNPNEEEEEYVKKEKLPSFECIKKRISDYLIYIVLKIE